MRYVYLKNGDAVAQVERYLDGVADRSGPDAFINDFLSRRCDDEVLVLCRADRRRHAGRGALLAEAVAGPRWLMFRGLRRFWAAIAVAVRIWTWKPDRVLLGCSGEILWFAVLSARLRRALVVNSRHGGLPGPGLFGRLKFILERISIAACHGVICHGPYLADGIRRMGIESRRVREFEVDLTSFGRTSDSITIPAVLADLVSRRRAIVMYVGRIQSSKGALDLLDAFLRLPADAAAASTLVFVGDGVDMPVLRSRVAQLGSDSVLLLGAVPHGQLPAVMRMATLIATPTQPQLPEGRCMVALEAMVLGIPVVAPNFAAFPYAVRHGVNGLLFEAGSIPALAECLARVIGDPGLHSELSAGAAQSGRELIAGFTSFGAAVEAAFGA